MKSIKTIIIITIIVALGITIYFFLNSENQSQPQYITVPVKKGTIVKKVEASGTINPINIVNVGTQVSGIIEKIYVDFNDAVKKGQILAQVDKSVLLSNLATVKAKKDKALTQKKLAELEYQRLKILFEKDYIARAELDKAETEFKSLTADYQAIIAEYKKAQTNLSYATIRSPINGVIISREVDQGQTVSASLQAPELFKIAEDLTKMQIEASISEADVGHIKSGQKVSFTVDAFENNKFDGIVKQIRLNPETEENVVTYTVIILIDNNNFQLLPGMTAFVRILIAKKQNILKISNTVFAFQPQDKISSNLTITTKKLSPDETMIYLLQNQQITPLIVKKGLANTTETEIIHPQLQENDLIIEDLIMESQNYNNNNSKKRSQRYLMRRGMGRNK